MTNLEAVSLCTGRAGNLFGRGQGRMRYEYVYSDHYVKVNNMLCHWMLLRVALTLVLGGGSSWRHHHVSFYDTFRIGYRAQGSNSTPRASSRIRTGELHTGALRTHAKQSFNVRLIAAPAPHPPPTLVRCTLRRLHPLGRLSRTPIRCRARSGPGVGRLCSDG